MNKQILYSVFTKPWKTKSLHELGAWVADLGFDGIELPVRPGYQIEPENVYRLPAAATTLAEFGVKIYSIAGPADEATIAACAETGAAAGCTPTIRTMARIADGERYIDAEARFRREYDAILALLEKHDVQIGVQNHCGRFIANAAGLRNLVQKYDPRRIAIVWDAAHNALQGQDLDYALDIVWPHLCMVNLKNVYWRRVSGTEAEIVQWKYHWTSGRQGLASWPDVAAELQKRRYTGVVCLTAEYSDKQAADRLIRQDIALAKSLFDRQR